MLLWEAVFVFKVALFTLKAKLIGGERQGFVVRPGSVLAAAEC